LKAGRSVNGEAFFDAIELEMDNLDSAKIG
jgi:hypothetical protein